METKTKVFFLLVLSLFSTTPTIAFASESLSQKAGYKFFWEVKELKDFGDFLWENPFTESIKKNNKLKMKEGY